MSQIQPQVIACAHPNIALIKYWGKRDIDLNLPAVGSLSVTLDNLQTTTTICANNESDTDQMWLNEQFCGPQQMQKAARLIEFFRTSSNDKSKVAIRTHNNFPTAAGLASSASGFAALVVALNEFFKTSMTRDKLCEWARIGSGSAARSLFGGFVLMKKGRSAQGHDAVAKTLLDSCEWPMQVLVAITDERAKSISSTAGMELTRKTSVFYHAWVESQENDLSTAAEAIKARDFYQLAEISEQSCLKMHALMMSAAPGLIYWNAATVNCIHSVRSLRAAGHAVFFTVDAGPQVKVVCLPEAARHVKAALTNTAGVRKVLEANLGPGAWIEKAKYD